MSFWSSNSKKKSPTVESVGEVGARLAESPVASTEPVGFGVGDRLSLASDPYLVNGGKVRVAIPRNVSFRGSLYYDAPVKIEGKVFGNFSSTNDVFVAKAAHVEGRLSVGMLLVEGAVKGQVQAFEKVEIRDGGAVDGQLQSRALVLHEGGACNAEIKAGGLSRFEQSGVPADQLSLGFEAKARTL